MDESEEEFRENREEELKRIEKRKKEWEKIRQGHGNVEGEAKANPYASREHHRLT